MGKLRISTVVIGVGVIIGAIAGGVLTMYVLGGLLEADVKPAGFGWVPVLPHAHHIVNIVISMLTFVMVIATFLTLAERKWSALMQNRIGPNRARLPIPGLSNHPMAGIPHIVTDVLKLLTKEDFVPKDANRLLFNLGPILAFAPVFALFAIVPTGPTVTVFGKEISAVAANPDFGLLYLFGIASLAVYGTSLAGWSSNNKFALLGGVRASSQMISYEVGLGLSLVGMMIAFSTVKLAGADGMSDMQAHYLPGWSTKLGGVFDVGIPQWGILLQPLGFIIFFAAAFAETKRAPFDVPEGESEIIGYFVEYSGMKFGLFMIAEFVEVVVLSGVLIAIFFGGPYLPGFGNEWLRDVLKDHQWIYGTILGTVFWLKVVLLCYLQLAIRWTFPRFRYDQIQSLGWKILLPVGLVNVFLSGALILWDPSLHALAIMGVVEIGIMIAMTLTPAPAKARADAHIGHHGPAGDGHHALPAGHH
jgi:NADH-quinone oxidoreductase subunit H